MSDRITIPTQGRDKDTILNELSKLHLKDIPWKEGRAWSMVYYVDEDHQDLLESPMMMMMISLLPDYYQTLYLVVVHYMSVVRVSQILSSPGRSSELDRPSYP